MILGAHISASGGVSRSPSRGKELGCDAIQIFSKNQKQWKAKPLDSKECDLFKKEMKECSIRASAVHTSYLINLAASDRERKVKSRKAFMDEIERAGALDIDALVFHPGSHLGEGVDSGVRQCGEALAETASRASELNLLLLIETTAGQGSGIGHTFEQIRDIIDVSGGGGGIGVCYDTAHTFAAGYDIRDKKAYTKTFRDFDSIIGLKRLKAFHLNDSMKDYLTKRDRHENIGKGFIRTEAFRLLVNDRRFAEIPGYLETPGGDECYRKNLRKLKKLIEK